MTLRDIGEWFSGFWAALVRDVQIVFSENILDWPLWTFFLVAALILALVVPNLSTIREEEEANIDDGVWGSIWAALIGFCFMSYLIFAAFTGRHGLPSWLGFVGLISWPIFGYGFLLKLVKRLSKKR